jgi:nucleoside-diphosphate kinase
LTEGFIRYTRDDAKQHYAEHVEKPFYPEMENYIVSDKAYGMIVEGENAIAKIRSIIGSTIKKDKETGAIILPEVGTIRRDIPDMLGEVCCMPGNVMHASDSQSSAEIEIAIFERLLKDKNHKNHLNKNNNKTLLLAEF